ncbi:MAG: hypothetical protein WA581_16105 [Candidatus Acidiferrales bacterium]
MNRKITLGTAAVLFAAVGICWAASSNVFMGTWQLNEAKSKTAAGAGKNSTVAYTMEDDNIKCTIDGTDASGQAIHSEWTGKFDGKDHPVTGDPTSDMRSYRMINSHTLSVTEEKDGKVVDTVRIVVSADGKTRTVTAHGRNAKGMPTTSVTVYDKQ